MIGAHLGRHVTCVIAIVLFACALRAQTGYVPNRVYDSHDKAFTDFESMLVDVARADVVFIGEQHDDPNTHRLELGVLEGLARRRGDIVLAMEMFERDVQAPLDRFANGQATEAEFLKVARPWPAYSSDYKPLVDFAIEKDWPIVAGNVPRAIASEVSKNGFDVLKTKTAAEKSWFAAETRCPRDDDYFKRFAEAMGSHPIESGPGSSSAVAAARQSLERFYDAQCLKDETMAESAARAYQAASTNGVHPIVVHVNGAFHSDFHLGTADRTARRLPGKRVVVIAVLPVDKLDGLSPSKDDRKRGDYLVYTLK
jgi:uncharacterized iron-regulated protein